MGAVSGIEPLVAQAHGANRPRRVRLALQRGVIIALWGCIPLGLVLLAMVLAVAHLGTEKEMVSPARAYMLARLAGLPAVMLFFAFKSHLQAVGRVRAIFVSSVVMNVFNVPADFLLIFGDEGLRNLGLPEFGFPALGVVGAGVASALASWLRTFLLLFAVRSALREDEEGVPAQADEELPSPWQWAGIARVLRLGIPIGLSLGLEVGVFSFVSILMARIGTEALAAHQIALNLAAGSFNLVVGVGSATGVVVGQAIGAGDSPRARRAGFSGLLIGVGIMAVFAGVFLMLPRQLATIFTTDAAVIGSAASLLMVAGIFQISDGLQAVAQGALRGAGDTTLPFIIQAIAHWLIGLPLGIVLAHPLGMGGPGLWWGLTAGLTVAALLFVIRFHQKSAAGFSRLER
jgi:MATE family multidrug resistance protein